MSMCVTWAGLSAWKREGNFSLLLSLSPPILITAWCQKLRPLFILTSNCYCFSQCAFDFLLEGSQLKHFGWKSIEISHHKCSRNKFNIVVVNLLLMIWMILCHFKKASVKSGHWIVITIVCVWYPEIIVVRDSTYRTVSDLSTRAFSRNSGCPFPFFRVEMSGEESCWDAEEKWVKMMTTVLPHSTSLVLVTSMCGVEVQ